MGQVRRQYGSGSIFQRKDGMWIGRFEVGVDRDGQRRRITVSAATETRCKEKLRAKQIEVARHGAPEKSTGMTITVAQWGEQWLPEVEQRLRPSAYANVRSNVRRWIIPTIGRKRLAALTPGDVRAVLTAMRDAGRSPSTRIHAHTDMMQMFRAAIVEGHPIPERVLMVPRPQLGENDRTALTFADANAVLAVAVDQPDASKWVAAFLQGLRQGERLGLTWECVDLDAGTIDISWQLQPLPYVDNRDKARGFRVPDAYMARHLTEAFHLVRPKTKRSRRVIPLVPWMTRALADWREVAGPSPYGLVWPADDGRPQRAETDRAEWVALQVAAGVQHPAGRHYVLHEARHTTATLLRELQVEVETIEAILGHSKFVEAYDHADRLESSRAALGRLAERLALPG